MSSADFSTVMLEKAGIVVPPGTAYGPHGEGFVRIALSVDKARLAEAFDRMAKDQSLTTWLNPQSKYFPEKAQNVGTSFINADKEKHYAAKSIQILPGNPTATAIHQIPHLGPGESRQAS